MRFLPTRIHGLIDYAWGVMLMATPFALQFPKGSAAFWLAWFFGAGAIAYSLATDYEVGLVPLVPMRLHLALDAAAGALLAASPWLLGIRPASPFVAFGVFAVAASLITRTRPAGGSRSGGLAGPRLTLVRTPFGRR